MRAPSTANKHIFIYSDCECVAMVCDKINAKPVLVAMTKNVFCILNKNFNLDDMECD